MKKLRPPKYTYQNYQFYELKALEHFLDKKRETGSLLDRIYGGHMRFLRFKPHKSDESGHHFIFKKHLDSEVDKAVEAWQKDTSALVLNQHDYSIFYGSPNEESTLNMASVSDKQKRDYHLSVTKAILSTLPFLLITLIALGLKLYTIQIGDFNLNLLTVGITAALVVTFLIYVTGDLHDYFKGYGIIDKGQLHFTSRSALKETLFTLGDVLYLVTFIFSMIGLIGLGLMNPSLVTGIEIFRIVFVSILIGFSSTIKTEGSYASTLWVATGIIISSLWMGVTLF